MKKSMVLAFCALATLAACGGGGDDNSSPPATSQVPASASMTAAGFVGYLGALVASAADMLEPVDVSNVTPPTDDKAEPTVVD